MLTTIEGIYEDGEVLLSEKPPTHQKTRVLITFLEETKPEDTSQKVRKAGGLAGRIWMADDFNDGL